VLVDIAGAPLLERQLSYLGAEGVTRVVVNAHHLADQVEAFADGYNGPVELIVVTEEKLLGTAGGVRNALDWLGEEPFLVLYGDVVIDESLDGLFTAHAAAGAAATLTVYATTDVVGKGTVEVDGSGRVTGFAEKASVSAGQALVNAGIYVVDPGLVTALPAGTEVDFGHDVFPDALARGVAIQAYELERPVIDVGTPEGLERARARAAGF
jgi:NDP-sugar pyrophosphorylase family protein